MIVNIIFALNIKSRFCDHVISRQTSHAMWLCIEKITTHHQLQDDASYHVRWHARMTT
jgi:hypothetical protein